MILMMAERDNAGEQIARAISQKPAGEPLEIRFLSGDYFFSPEHAFVRDIYITNASTVKDGEPPTRRIGILLEHTEDVTLAGENTTLWFDNRMTQIVIQNCRNIRITGLSFNFIHPSVFEFEVTRKSLWSVDIRPNEHCDFALDGNRLRFPFDGISGMTIMQQRDALAGVTRRVGALCRAKGSVFSAQLSAKRLPDGIIRVKLPFSAFREGGYYQLSNPFRDGVGTLIDRSNGVTLRGNRYQFMHGLGIACQLSRDVSIHECDFLPDDARGITTCGAADMIHAAMCMGTLAVRNCNFEGARDDVINVHGIHFRVVRAEGTEIEVRFCQRETYGFLAFDAGDRLEFVSPSSLDKTGEAVVAFARLVDPRTIRLTLDRAVSKRMRGLAVENVTKTCDVMIDNIDCRHIPTRGILVSTRGKVVIQNCAFHDLPMANILIADDARSWFESGRVCDVLIQHNLFEHCGAYPIDIFPEAWRGKTPVHQNITICGNTFVISGRKLARVKRTRGLVWRDNVIYASSDVRVRLIRCRDVRWEYMKEGL